MKLLASSPLYLLNETPVHLKKSHVVFVEVSQSHRHGLERVCHLDGATFEPAEEPSSRRSSSQVMREEAP